jgi:thiol-disulfide isomerase/thioredoxin
MKLKKVGGYLLILAAIALVVIQYIRFRVPPTMPWGNLSLKELNNQPYKLNFNTDKFIAISFFATWCGSCIQEFKTIESECENGKLENIDFIAITDESDEKINQFVQKYQFSHIKFIKANEPLKNYGIRAFPTSYVLNKNGQLLYEKVGEINWSNATEVQKILTK